MRIAMFLDTDFPPDPRVENEATSLIEDGHEVFLFSLSYKYKGPQSEIIKGIRVERFKAGQLIYKLSALAYTIPLFHFLVKSRIKKFISKIKPEILHIHDMPLAKVVLHINKALQLPVVLDLHEDRPAIMRYYPHLKNGPGRFLIKPDSWEYWQKKLVRKSDNVIVVTSYARDNLIAMAKVSRDKFVVVPNTIRSEIFLNYTIKQSLIDKFKGTINVLYLGDTGLRRGTDTAIKAIYLLKDSYPNLRLILVGENRDNVILRQMVRALNLENYIYFEGWQDLTLFKSYLMAADIAISPLKRNRHHDTTLANKLFQYMAVGVPVVVSDCPAQAEVVEKAECGLVHRAGDDKSLAEKISYIIDNERERARMGGNAKKAIDNEWDWRFKSKGLIDFYRQKSAMLKQEAES